MKTLKRSFHALTLLTLLTAAAAHAQQYAPVVVLPISPFTTLTQNITGGSTSNYTGSVNVRTANTVGIYTSFKLDGAGTDGVIFKFKKSSDGSNFETTPSILITNAANGATAVLSYNEVAVAGVHSIRLSSIVNGVAAQSITNLNVTVGVKNFIR